MFMPDVDGLQMARAITEDPLLQGMPLIMLTSSVPLQPGRGAGGHRAVAEQAGAQLGAVRPPGAADGPERGRAPSRGRRAETAPVNTPARGSVLVVEDNPLNQLVAEGVVSRLGYDAHTVVDGVEALIAVDERTYSAVLMDCHMPRMDGFTATGRSGDASSTAGCRSSR